MSKHVWQEAADRVAARKPDVMPPSQGKHTNVDIPPRAVEVLHALMALMSARLGGPITKSGVVEIALREKLERETAISASRAKAKEAGT